MNINKTWFIFHRDDIPNWQCPTCGSASLNLKPEELRVYDSAETARFSAEDWFDPDFIRHRFSATLHCANLRCNEVIMMVGAGYVETEHTQNETGNWDINYTECFTPRFFEPCLTPISIPEKTPTDVKNALDSAFSIIFSNRDAAANQLRVSIEVLLDEQGIESQREDGSFIPLGKRIKNRLNNNILIFKERFEALQWIGNDGSHGNGTISIDDLLAGLELIESLLATLYPSPRTDLDELARKMIEKKNPKKASS